MFTTKRLMLRGMDKERDGKFMLQNANNTEMMDLGNPGPRVPVPRPSEQPPSSHVNALPRFAICLKPESPETSWPNNLGPDDDYYALAPPAIGYLGLQDHEFDYKNRIAYVGIGFPDPAHCGKGYGQEVLEWLLGYCFEQLGLHKVMLGVYENNPHAKACYERVGFVTEGRQRKMYFCGGRWLDCFIMGVLEEDWFENKRNKGEAATSKTVIKD